MGMEIVRENSHEIKNNISKVFIEKEKPYGIYLPEWESVVEAVCSFAEDHQKYPKVSAEDSLLFDRFHNTSKTEKTAVQDKLLLAERYFAHGESFWKINPGGQSFFDLDLTIEPLKVEAGASRSLDKYMSPYLLTIYSQGSNNDLENKLAEQLQLERAVYPREVYVKFGDSKSIDFDDVANRLNKVLENTDENKKLSRENITKFHYRSLGEQEGLELKMYMLRWPDEVDYKPPGVLRIVIQDSLLRAAEYGVAVIPPEKRQQAQALAEKIANAFKPTNFV